MIGFPNAKINLGLYITDKRPDGYHNLISCFYPVAWREALEIIPSASFSFAASGLSIPGDQQANLVVKAYQLLQAEFRLPPCSIHLHKVIPMGAGLGGGSSDAAEALKLLNSLFELNLDKEKLMTYSAQLGSDCPFFIYNQACLATSRGEVLEPINLSLQEYQMVLIHPGVHISTQEAYGGVKPRPMPIPIQKILQQDPEHWKDQLKNQFEEHLFEKYPEVRLIKEKLYEYGAVYASMSGSGSAVYGLFKDSIALDAMHWPSHYTVKHLEPLA